MHIRQIDTNNRQDVQRFIQFPFDLYRGCPQWVPPLASDARAVFNRKKHPFYRHSDADFFLAERDGRVVGRIAVLDHRLYNEYHNRRTAFFYLFECEDDAEAAQGLFAAACDWARARGLTEMKGPHGFLRSDGHGVLVEGFEHRPAMGIAYNYPYYDALIMGAGFQGYDDFLSGRIDRGHELPPRFFEIAETVRERRGFRIQSFRSKREMRRWVPIVGPVLQAAFADTDEFCPFTPEEFRQMVNQLILAARPDCVKLVMKGDKPVGFLFTFSDISAALQKTGGRLWPFGWIHILREFRRTDWANINGLGLLPEYQGMGANAVLYAELANTLMDSQFNHGDIVQVSEANLKSMGDMEAIGVKWYKRHRVYRKDL
ncbi:MAG: hypothetical protein Kow00123_27650 [Anaerolineales bacterium]